MTQRGIDRIESAIRHIQTSTDIDQWAAEIAVEAMRKQIPQRPVIGYAFPENMSDFIERQESKGISEINKFIDGLEEIFADLRERHVDDSVCGLCEYDGAYMGQSGDWCNECPGFDKDDCFKLSDETRKKWIEEIVNAYPDHTADIGKKVSISCSQENDLIDRQMAIDALARMMPRSYTPDGSHPADEEIFRAQEVFADCIEALEILPSAQPATNCSEIPNGSDDTISRRAAIDLVGDWIYNPEDLRYHKDVINSIPAAQPEIIRCKDCKHRDKYGCCKYWKGLAMGDIPIATDDYDFCSYAKRI